MADINVTMSSPNGVTLATKGKYCPENVKIAPSFIKDVEYNQEQARVRAFINAAQSAYSSNDYSNSIISDYATPEYVPSCSKPLGGSLDTVAGTLIITDEYLSKSTEKTVTQGTQALKNISPNNNHYVVENDGLKQAGKITPTGTVRMLDTNANNVRDLGGWNCDGGTVKHGKLFRGGDCSALDIPALVEQCGINVELDLRGSDVTDTSSELGEDIIYIRPPEYVWYTIAPNTSDTWREILRCVFDAVKRENPVYYHCSAGRDRTGTVSCIIEALLGVSQTDIDIDYELTNFAMHSGTNADPLRTKISWSGTGGLIPMINAIPWGNSFSEKVINWVASLGFTADEINAFRNAMIDGTPQEVSLSIGTAIITNNLEGLTSNNPATSLVKYQPYYAELTPEVTTQFKDYSLKIGGVDVTNQYAYIKTFAETLDDNYKIIVDIPSGVINGNVVVEARAEASVEPYTMLAYAEVLDAQTGNVNTEYIPTINTGFLVKFKSTNASSSKNLAVGFCGNNDFCVGFNSSTDCRAFKGTNKSYALGVSAGDNAWHTVKLNYDADGKVYIDGASKNWNAQTTANDFTKPLNIFSAGTHATLKNKAVYLQIETFVITENGAVVKTLKPCRRNSDNNVGFMCVETDIFCPSVGSVIAGAAI